jgi:hypothetical protein
LPNKQKGDFIGMYKISTTKKDFAKIQYCLKRFGWNEILPIQDFYKTRFLPSHSSAAVADGGQRMGCVSSMSAPSDCWCGTL